MCTIDQRYLVPSFSPHEHPSLVDVDEKSSYGTVLPSTGLEHHNAHLRGGRQFLKNSSSQLHFKKTPLKSPALLHTLLSEATPPDGTGGGWIERWIDQLYIMQLDCMVLFHDYSFPI